MHMLKQSPGSMCENSSHKNISPALFCKLLNFLLSFAVPFLPELSTKTITRRFAPSSRDEYRPTLHCYLVTKGPLSEQPTHRAREDKQHHIDMYLCLPSECVHVQCTVFTVLVKEAPSSRLNNVLPWQTDPRTCRYLYNHFQVATETHNIRGKSSFVFNLFLFLL